MYLFFDTETTGLPTDRKAPLSDLDNWPRLVQLAWLLCDQDGRPVGSRSAIVKPEGFTIPADASRVHGITTARAISEGLDLVRVLKEFASAIAQSHLLVSHGMSFDEKVVGAEFLRTGVKSRLLKIPRLCTMEASTEFCAIPGPYGFKWPKLPELHFKLFRKNVKEAHDAAADVAICSKCFFELKRLGVVRVTRGARR